MTQVLELSIIVVDDTRYSRTVLQNTLQRIGYTDIRPAASAKEALAMMEERLADVVLADWFMPEMDGLELTQVIRQRDEERHHYTSILLFTAEEGDAQMLKAFVHGVDDYLTKPISDLQLTARLHAAGRIAALQNTLLETTSALTSANRLLEHFSTQDPLTGLANRRAVNKRLEALLLESQAREGGLCIALVDIDHFTDVNREHGHSIGDEVLSGLGKRLRLVVRPTDLVARLNGGQFAVVMQIRDPEQFNHAVFERILTSISREPIRTSEADIRITVSIGVHDYYHGQPMQTIHVLMNHAEENLKRAKTEGRNRIIGPE
ncbi:diguanylate cyclase [Thiorhodospira sibirica]|uniref:GGDEF domain-containing response regulator n=1 Tax=Thiorhodospira sibirica TaxID=154347 RepID=UPI00022C1769|nr:diguanylate cyclase [Thiorhodospira sibirica]